MKCSETGIGSEKIRIYRKIRPKPCGNSRICEESEINQLRN